MIVVLIPSLVSQGQHPSGNKTNLDRVLKKGHKGSVETKGSKASDAIEISDDPEGLPTFTQPNRRVKSSKMILKPSSVVYVTDSSESEPIRNRSTSTRKRARAREALPPRQDKSNEDVGATKATSSKRRVKPIDTVRVIKAISSDVKREPVDGGADESDSDLAGSDAPIDWPPTPERPSKAKGKSHKPSKADVKAEADANEVGDLEPKLLPGQDLFLADTYDSMEVLKCV